MYSYFLKAKHKHMNNSLSKETIYTLENEGLNEVGNCYYSIGNFLQHNLSKELSNEFKRSFSKLSKDSEFPIALVVSVIVESSENIKNVYEAEVIIKKETN